MTHNRAVRTGEAALLAGAIAITGGSLLEAMSEPSSSSTRVAGERILILAGLASSFFGAVTLLAHRRR